MKKLYNILSPAITAIMLLSLWACSSDDSVTPAPVNNSIIISSRTEQTADDNELIHDYTVVFVNGASTVCAVVNRAETAVKGFDYEEFEVEINPGIYTIYAFANCSALPDNIRDVLGTLSVGSPLPANFPELTAKLNAYYAPGSLIPMSGIMKGVTISGLPNSNLSVEVIRMLARIEFMFTNATSDPVEITGVSLLPVYCGDVSALPMFETGSGKIARPVLLPGSVAEAVEHKIGAELQGGQSNLASHFYIRESVADQHPSGLFSMSVKVIRNDRAEEELYALTPDLNVVRRNDYIQIPIVLTDYMLDVDTEFYPPIGGYPAVVVEHNNNEFYIRFGSSGRFIITPRVRNTSDGTFVSPSCIDIHIEAVDDPSGILDGDNDTKLQEQAGELLGTLASGTARGTARIELHITVNEPGKPVSRTFKRNFYIVRD